MIISRGSKKLRLFSSQKPQEQLHRIIIPSRAFTRRLLPGIGIGLKWRYPGIAATQGRCPEMKWITRERVKVDRVACPWLIKRFVDKDAEFYFVPADQVMNEAERLGATPSTCRMWNSDITAKHVPSKRFSRSTNWMVIQCWHCSAGLSTGRTRTIPFTGSLKGLG